MRIVFVRGWIIPHVALGFLLLFVVTMLPRYWARFRVEAPNGRGLVAVAFGMPSIAMMLRWAIQTELKMNGFEDAPAGTYFKWGLRGIVLLTVFLAAVVYILGLIRVGDGFSFLVLCAIVNVASLAAVYTTVAPRGTGASEIIAPRT